MSSNILSGSGPEGVREVREGPRAKRQGGRMVSEGDRGDRWDAGLGLQGWGGPRLQLQLLGRRAAPPPCAVSRISRRLEDLQVRGGESKLIFELRLQNRNVHELSITARISPIDGGKTEQRADSPNGETQGIISSAISLPRYHDGKRKGWD